VLSACGVRPFPARAFTSERTLEANEQAAARMIIDVADDPVVSSSSAIGEIMLAHSLDIFGKAARQLSCWAFHHRLLSQMAARVAGATRSDG
jgi:hypothetical protein